jgi:hypothetical protein
MGPLIQLAGGVTLNVELLSINFLKQDCIESICSIIENPLPLHTICEVLKSSQSPFFLFFSRALVSSFFHIHVYTFLTIVNHTPTPQTNKMVTLQSVVS